MIFNTDPVNTAMRSFKQKTIQYYNKKYYILELFVHQNHKNLFRVFIGIVFILTWIIHYYTPMHSDDYAYYLKGLSLESTIKHYLNWSGRLLADFISRVILSIGNQHFISFVNTFGHLSLVYLITKIVYGRKPVSIVLFSSIFILYWIANPNLGQTTFWIVGSANYMWTNIFICLFLYFYLNWIIDKKKIKKLTILGLLILAFMSGITNENTSLTLLVVTFYYAILAFRKNKDNIPIFLTIFVLIGVLVLILAPGNFHRLAHPAFDVWREYSLAEKIGLELYSKLPAIFSHFWLIFLLYIMIMFYDRQKNIDAVIFMIASIFASLAFTLSPAMPPRAMNGILVFLLISFAYVSRDFIEKKLLFKKIFVVITITIGCLYFVPSYWFIYKSYTAMTRQAKIRDNLIINAKKENMESINIPKFYPGRLVKDGDMIDRYFSSGSMKDYFNYKGEIIEYDIDYDYSK